MATAFHSGMLLSLALTPIMHSSANRLETNWTRPPPLFDTNEKIKTATHCAMYCELGEQWRRF